MPRAIAKTRKEQAQRRIAESKVPKVLAVDARLIVHTAREDGPGEPCPCCGSKFAIAVRERPIDTLLIAPGDRFRMLRSEAEDTFEFDEYAAEARAKGHSYELILRCSDWIDQESRISEEEILFDFTTKTFVLGGANRSGKTQLAVNWLALRWFLRGADEALFRIYAPLLKQAHIGMKKLIRGDVNTAPLIPAELVTSSPRTIRDDDQAIRLIDGSAIELMHARSAAHIKGEAVVDSIWLEATECPNDEVYPVVQARHVSTHGQLILDSTPKRGHWMIDHVENARKDFQAHLKAVRDGKPPPPLITRAVSKPIEANPWNDPEEIKRQREAIEKVDPIMARREFGGEWIGRYELMFAGTEGAWDGEKNTVDLWEPDVRLIDQNLRDVTESASRVFWGGVGHQWIVGIDVNVNPHTAVICKLFEHIAHPGIRGLLVYDELRSWGVGTYEAARQLSLHGQDEPGVYRGAGVAIDANAAHDNQHVAHSKGRPFTGVQDYERFGFNVRTNLSAKGKPQNPALPDSTALLRHLMRSWVGPSGRPVRRLLVNAAKAPRTIKAVESQQDHGNGMPIKMNVSGTAADREIYALTDSLRYLTWPVFSQQTYGYEPQVY